MLIQNLPRSSVERVCASQVIPDLNSCVRELVENSLDARSKSVSVRVRNSGAEIEVADNGIGIAKENWSSLFRPHHTSKLTEFESLVSGSHEGHGFRGEALAAICSLSKKVRLATRTADMDAGYVMEFDNSCNMLTDPEPVSKGSGTAITVYGLFEETLPVRYHEMMRTMKKELKMLSSQIYELAIINPLVSFELLIDGKCAINPVTGTETPYEVYKRLINGPELVEFSCATQPSFEVRGWITPPVPTPWSLSAGAGTSGGQYFFLNNRPINPVKKMVRAINRIYAKFEIKRVSGIFCISVPENRNYFDLNVSVDKREILFSHGFDDLLSETVVEELEGLFGKQTVSLIPTPQRILVTPLRKRPITTIVQSTDHVSIKTPKIDTSDVQFTAIVPATGPDNDDVINEKDPEDLEKNKTEELENLPVLPYVEPVPTISMSFPKELFRSMSVIGQFNNGFIITRLDGIADRVPELFLIDQHAANEKFLFEEYFKNIRLHSQKLIIPLKIRAPPWIESIILEYKDVLAENGFVADLAHDSDGNKCIELSSLPTLSGIGFNRSAALSVKDFMEIAEALHEGTIRMSGDKGTLYLLKSLSSVRAHIASKACRTAIMVGDPLTLNRMTEVVFSLSNLDQPWNCPHGRPTMKHLLSLGDLSKLQ